MAEMDPQTRTLKHKIARWLAERNIRVFPCTPGSKAPLPGCRWKEEATDDLAQIDRWWTAHRDANVGVPMKLNGLVAVDVDRDEPDCGWRAFAEGHDIPETRETTTANGGSHRWFRDGGHSFAGQIRDSHGNVVKHVDVKHDGYVLAPGSVVIEDGEAKTYTPKNDAKIASAPEWLIKGAEPRLSSSPASAATSAATDAPIAADAVRRAFDALPPPLGNLISAEAVQGTRSTVFMNATGWMKEKGLQPDMIEAIFRLHPQGCAGKYLIDQGDRLAGEVVRAFGRAKGRMDLSGFANYSELAGQGAQAAQSETKPPKDWKWVDCSQPVAPVLTNLWLVKGIIPENGSVVVYGPPGVGKSLVALDMAMHVAAGMDWHGRKVKPVRVAVICPESRGASGVNRLVAWQQHNQATPPVLHSSEFIDLLTDDKDALSLIEALRDKGFGLVIIDTLARSMPGGDENTAKDMGAVCRRAEMIGSALNATVLVVHHTGKDAEKGARGSTVLLGAIDTEAKVQKGRTVGTGVLSVTKQRNGEDGIKLGYRIEVVTLGQDQDGDHVTSAVAVPEAVTAPKVGAGNSLSPQALAAYGILEALVEKTEEETDQRPATVPVAEWRSACRSHEAFKGIGTDDAFRQAFSRGRRSLEDSGLVASYGDKRHGAVFVPED